MTPAPGDVGEQPGAGVVAGVAGASRGGGQEAPRGRGPGGVLLVRTVWPGRGAAWSAPSSAGSFGSSCHSWALGWGPVSQTHRVSTAGEQLAAWLLPGRCVGGGLRGHGHGRGGGPCPGVGHASPTAALSPQGERSRREAQRARASRPRSRGTAST